MAIARNRFGTRTTEDVKKIMKENSKKLEQVAEQIASASDTNDLLCCENTDKEIWREKDDDFYSPSIHVTENGKIGIDVGGYVFVKDVRDWHRLATNKD